MTEREKLEKGLWYDANYDAELLEERLQAEDLCFAFNQTRPKETERKEELLKQLLPHKGEHVTILSPFYTDYGYNCRIGEETFQPQCLPDGRRADHHRQALLYRPQLRHVHGKPSACGRGAKPGLGAGKADYHWRQCLDWGRRHHPSGGHHWRGERHRREKRGDKGYSPNVIALGTLAASCVPSPRRIGFRKPMNLKWGNKGCISQKCRLPRPGG